MFQDVLLWAQQHEGFAAMGYNDRPYEGRGWCVLEDSLTREAVGRSHQPGFEDVKEQMDAAQLVKLYDISGEFAPAQTTAWRRSMRTKCKHCWWDVCAG